MPTEKDAQSADATASSNSADWSTPGAYPVVAGVHRIPMPMPSIGLSAMNAYALASDDGLVMIDSGWSPLPDSRVALQSALADIGYELADIRGFLITHLHRDHYTYAVEHRREFGSWIGLGEGEQGSLLAFRGFSGRPHTVELARLRHSGASALAESVEIDSVDPSIWETPDRWIAPMATFDVGGNEITAISTPGHTHGHMVYLDRERGLAFTGDHVLPRITPTVGSEAAPQPRPLADFMDSLGRMSRLPESRVLPAHGAMTAYLHPRSAELLVHHEARLEACRAAVDSVAATASEIASRLDWTRRSIRLDELSPDNQMRAIFETGAHLELLAERGRIDRIDLAGVAYFNKT